MRDDELQIPIRYESYDWPQKEGGQPVLLEEYTYTDLKVNVGLTDKDFDPDNEVARRGMHDIALRYVQLADLLRQVREVCLGGYAHQSLPLARLARRIEKRWRLA